MVEMPKALPRGLVIKSYSNHVVLCYQFKSCIVHLFFRACCEIFGIIDDGTSAEEYLIPEELLTAYRNSNSNNTEKTAHRLFQPSNFKFFKGDQSLI